MGHTSVAITNVGNEAIDEDGNNPENCPGGSGPARVGGQGAWIVLHDLPLIIVMGCDTSQRNIHQH